MQIVFIINPIAGSKKKKTEIIDLINKHFIDQEILYTQKSGDATIFSEEAVRKKKDIVVAVGGDGTVNECAKALNNTKIPLGIIPCGSGNGFATSLAYTYPGPSVMSKSLFALIKKSSVKNRTVPLIKAEFNQQVRYSCLYIASGIIADTDILGY